MGLTGWMSSQPIALWEKQLGGQPSLFQAFADSNNWPTDEVKA